MIITRRRGLLTVSVRETMCGEGRSPGRDGAIQARSRARALSYKLDPTRPPPTQRPTRFLPHLSPSSRSPANTLGGSLRGLFREPHTCRRRSGTARPTSSVRYASGSHYIASVLSPPTRGGSSLGQVSHIRFLLLLSRSLLVPLLYT